MFFGSPAPPTNDTTYRPNIQVLQHDIVYDTELKVSSLAGLQYLSKQRQILATKYPNHQISLARMVSYNLRQHVLAAYNHLWYKDSNITGSESNEILVEDWLSLSNAEVQAILVEAARPRTREMCARELILFLGKDIPQSPPISPDNFSKLFYGPMVKSLTDLQHLCSLLSADTSPYSNNSSKIPVSGYGTKDSPGQIQIWAISLGSQKNSVLNWLGKDVLMKIKNMESAIKYIRSKFMEGRHHSELRQEFDAKLTPIRYDDLRSTQGESYNRQQTPTFSRQPLPSTLNSLDFQPDDPNIDDTFDEETDDDMTHLYVDTSENPAAPTEADINYDLLLPLAANDYRNNTRQAIASTYQGYCSELFVFGTCPRKQNGCPFDHSAPALERCIRSFTLLSKRELIQHGQLPSWSTNKEIKPPTHISYTSNRPDQSPSFNRSRDHQGPDRHIGTHNQPKSYNN